MASKSLEIEDVVKNFKQHSRRWREIVESANPLQEKFPSLDVEGQPKNLGNFTKLCLVKALVPGKFITSVRELVVREQGEDFLNPPLFDIERSFADSSSAIPLIFVLPGADPLNALSTFAKRKKKDETLRSISLG